GLMTSQASMTSSPSWRLPGALCCATWPTRRAHDVGAGSRTRAGRQLTALGYLVTDTCVCLRPTGHDCGCWCEHGFQRLVYRVDDDGREHYATRPLEHQGQIISWAAELLSARRGRDPPRRPRRASATVVVLPLHDVADDARPGLFTPCPLSVTNGLD